MNKLIKQHWNQFNDIKGSKKSKTQFHPCLKHSSHITRCISSIKYTLTLLTQAIGIEIWLLFNIFFHVGNQKRIDEMSNHCFGSTKLDFHFPFQ